MKNEKPGFKNKITAAFLISTFEAISGKSWRPKIHSLLLLELF
jgi:hypothetical protein